MMTKAQILQGIRDLVNEQSTDAGTLLSDTGNLLGFLDDAVEQVVLDLLDAFPNELLTYEDVNMVAGTKTYALTKTFWRILKIEKTVTGENPTEMDHIDPLSRQYVETHGETIDKPFAADIINGVLWVMPTPAAAIANYIRVWGIQPETTVMANGGPAYLPRETHRLIVYWAANLVAVMIGAKPQPFLALYQNRLQMIQKNQRAKFQQAPRFVRESVIERTTRDEREKAFYDPDWP
jgi:hypothetical protein